jgi:hypothetical protein
LLSDSPWAFKLGQHAGVGRADSGCRLHDSVSGGIERSDSPQISQVCHQNHHSKNQVDDSRRACASPTAHLPVFSNSTTRDEGPHVQISTGSPNTLQYSLRTTAFHSMKFKTMIGVDSLRSFSYEAFTPALKSQLSPSEKFFRKNWDIVLILNELLNFRQVY